MKDLATYTPKRKLLSLKIERDEEMRNQFYLDSAESIYMVFNQNGHMPKRVYSPKEKKLAIGHAKSLARETGERFYVMRAWRAYDPEITPENL